VPRRVKPVTDNHDVLRRAFGATWWILFPCFVALVFRLTLERACADPYDLLAALASNPLWGWPIAGLYVTSHVWLIGVYLLTAASTDSFAPPPSAFRSVWRADYLKILSMAAAFVPEYLPVTLWRFIGAALHCTR
jgi:hypothetical protein